MPGCDVYANGNEIACKAGGGKVIATFPDVCLTPPSPPAGPIPVPYPNTSFSKDTKKGSKTVKIKNKEVMLKDKSYYKTSPLGDEAATKSLGMGVVSHSITGKTFFVSWSMDVKFEGKNVDRHIDMTTSNHASLVPNAAIPWANMSSMEIADWEDENETCACCNQPQHDSQRGGTPVEEDEWYDLNEVIPPDPPQPPAQHRRGMRQWEAQCADLAQRRRARNNRQRWVAEAKRNGCLAEKPCNVYRKVTSDHTAAAEREWGAYSGQYKDDNNVPFVKSTTRVRGKKVPQRGPVAHLTPKSAGGCPVGDQNLKPNNEFSAKCQEVDEELTPIQSDCAQKWDAELRGP